MTIFQAATRATVAARSAPTRPRTREGWRDRLAGGVTVGAVLLLALGAPTIGEAPEPTSTDQAPTVRDNRLELKLFADAPDIATPIGIAVDDANRVFVLESHTHLQASDYPGPRSDRVKIFTDDEGDGRPDRISIFADGIDDGMTMAFSPAGELFVVTSRSVLVLHDRDRDGVSEARTRVLQMVKPERVYDHAALLGIAFSQDGWLYVSRGNTGSAAWRIEGTDGSSVRGYGDGGNIIRCRPDGTRVEEVATGFWNPFGLQFDARGRLLATDNDPDGRGPNRLLHIVEGGDYGYRSLYGGSGIHPYLAWNGELPGTLPYAAALGEAPADLYVAARGGLPPDYRDDVLVAIWEERTIVRVRLKPWGASLRGEAVPLVEGGDRFRPVSFAADGRGMVYVTDWGKREYPNHGGGRIWRVSSRATKTAAARRSRRMPADGANAGLLPTLGTALRPAALDRLRTRLADPDPFIRHAAVMTLATPEHADRLPALVEDPDPTVRLGALLALERSRHAASEAVARRLLGDPDPLVRRMTLIWTGRSGLTALAGDLDRALAAGPATRELFDAYLATVQQLSREFVRAYASEAEPYAREIERRTPPGFVEAFINDVTRPIALRAMAVAALGNEPSAIPVLAKIAAPDSPETLRTEAVRSLGVLEDGAAAAALQAIVRDDSQPDSLRADALVGLAHQRADAAAEIVPLLNDRSILLRLEAARYLRSARLSDDTRALALENGATIRGPRAGEVRAQLAFLDAGAARRPRTFTQMTAVLTAGRGDAETGRRVFFSPASGCSSCHGFNGRGGDLGPDLTNVGRSKTRPQILDAILRPSAEISPDYQGWFVRTADGRLHTGRQIDVGEGGKAELYVVGGKFITLENIVEYGPLPTSLMPSGLDEGLTDQDLRDLVALLAPAALKR
ncbi:MAG TPA: PVC-type heme-binding CxxCH protein [Vicinamibacterales bacterium]|nr:PVC-type heme-binding CxxCH protein [Vicinamibacterales bacterium]